MDDKQENDKYEDLRRQAQQILGETNPVSEKQNELDRMLHELNVYQVELELQNQELRTAQRDLMDSRQDLKDLFDFAPLSYLEMDHNAYIVRANLLASQLLNIERHQLIGSKFTNFIHPSHQDEFYLLHGELLKTGIRQTTDLRLISPHRNSSLIVNLQVVLVNEESKKVRMSLADISTRKRLEERLAYLNKLDKAIFGLQSIDLIAETALINLRKFSNFDSITLVIFEENDARVDVVKKAIPLVEHSRLPLLNFQNMRNPENPNKPYKGMIPQLELGGVLNKPFQIIPIHHEETLGLLALELDGAEDIEVDIQLAVEFAVPLGIAIRQAKMLDRINRHSEVLETLVEDRTRTLRLRETQYRLLAENATDIVLLHNMDGICEYISPSVSDKLGYEQEEILEKSIIHLLHPKETIPLTQQAVIHWLTRRHTIRLQHKDGSYLWFESQGQGTDPRDVEHEKIVTILRDVTEQVKAQNAERQQRIFAEGLLDVTRTISSTLELDVVIKQIFSTLSQIIPYSSAFFVLLEDDIWNVIYTHNFTDSDLEQDLINRPYDIDSIPACQEMFETLKSVVITKLEDQNLLHFKEKEGANSFICVPIIIDGQVVAVLNLIHHRADFYGKTHIRHIEAFAEQASIAIRNAQLYEQGQSLAALEERQYLARELHDAVSQTLFSAGAIAETLPKLLRNGEFVKLKKLLETLEQLTTGARAEMRNLLMELRPNAFEQANLEILIQQLIQGFRARKSIPIIYEAGALPDLVPEVKKQLFRIVQSALNNIVQHADAKSVKISINTNDDHLILIIEDDGKGFDSSKVSSDRHGLKIMAERTEKIGGRLRIYSSINKGTSVNIVLPTESL